MADASAAHVCPGRRLHRGCLHTDDAGAHGCTESWGACEQAATDGALSQAGVHAIEFPMPCPQQSPPQSAAPTSMQAPEDFHAAGLILMHRQR